MGWFFAGRGASMMALPGELRIEEDRVLEVKV
jgi:hypothetical protein